MSGARCRLADQLMQPLLTVSRFSEIQVSFTFLVPAHLGSPGKRALNGCVCVESLEQLWYRVWAFGAMDRMRSRFPGEQRHFRGRHTLV